MSPLLALLALAPAEGPLDRLVGNWTSVERVSDGAGKPRTLRLRGTNRWIFKGELLEIHERYTIDGDKKPGENHILLRQGPQGRLYAWWHVPDSPEALIFEGRTTPDGMELTQKDGSLRLIYRWDGPDTYDAKLQTRVGTDGTYQDRTVARYTRRRS